MSCHTQEEIAAAIGYSEPAVRKFLSVEDAGDESNGLGRLTLTNEDIAIPAHGVALKFKAPILES